MARAPIKLQTFTSQSFSAYKLRMEMKLDGQSGEQAMNGNLIIETSKNVGKNQSRDLPIDGEFGQGLYQQTNEIARHGDRNDDGLQNWRRSLGLGHGEFEHLYQGRPHRYAVQRTGQITEFGQLIDSLAGDKVRKLRGALVGKEIINGLQTQHYTIDVAAMNAANSNSSATDHMESGDIWVALNGQYPVRLHAAGPTEIGSFLDDNDFAGHMDITFDVSDVNVPLNLALPCGVPAPDHGAVRRN